MRFRTPLERGKANLGWLAAALALLISPVAVQMINSHTIERIETRYRISLERLHELMVEKKEMPK